MPTHQTSKTERWLLLDEPDTGEAREATSAMAEAATRAAPLLPPAGTVWRSHSPSHATIVSTSHCTLRAIFAGNLGTASLHLAGKELGMTALVIKGVV